MVRGAVSAVELTEHSARSGMGHTNAPYVVLGLRDFGVIRCV